MSYLYETPIKMPRSTHYGNNYWLFQSRKIGRRVTAFSNLEYENLISLEMDPNVVFYCEQPCEQTVIIDGNKHHTVFDVYVVYRDGREVFQEVKYAEEIASETDGRSRKQINTQQYWCKQNNYPYELRTDKEIEIGQYTIRNLCYLCTKARRNTSTEAINDQAFLTYLKEHGEPTIGQLYVNGLLTTRSGIDYLADLYYRGKIEFSDIHNEPITNTTGVKTYGR